MESQPNVVCGPGLHPGLTTDVFWGPLGKIACGLIIIYHSVTINLVFLDL